MVVKLGIAFVLGGLATYAALALVAPNNYEDCILASLPGQTSDAAATRIGAACRAKFPEG